MSPASSSRSSSDAAGGRKDDGNSNSNGSGGGGGNQQQHLQGLPSPIRRLNKAASAATNIITGGGSGRRRKGGGGNSGRTSPAAGAGAVISSSSPAAPAAPAAPVASQSQPQRQMEQDQYTTTSGDSENFDRGTSESDVDENKVDIDVEENNVEGEEEVEYDDDDDDDDEEEVVVDGSGEEDEDEDEDDEDAVVGSDNDYLPGSSSNADSRQPQKRKGSKTSRMAEKGVKKASAFTKRMIVNPMKQVADTAIKPAKFVSSKVESTRRSSGGRKKPPLSPTTVPTKAGDDGNDVAENSLLTTIENRARASWFRGGTTADGFKPAVQGELPPLSVEDLGIGLTGGGGDGSGSGDESPEQKAKKQFARSKWMETMKALKSQKMIDGGGTSSNNHGGGAGGRHRRAHTLLAQVGEDDADEKKTADGKTDRHDKDNDGFGFFTQDEDELDVYSKIFGGNNASDASVDDNDDGDSDDENGRNEVFIDFSGHQGDNETPHERLPLLSGDHEGGEESRQRSSLMSNLQRQALARRKAIKRRWNAACSWLHPKEIALGVIHWFTHSSMIPALLMFILAWILFYYFGNPSLDFLPGHATVSWWLNFFGRQLLVMEIARFCQYIAIDCFVLSTRIVARILGSWMTYFCIQSKGWPFVVGCWGILDMLLLHGDNPFQVHWLYWTGIGIYSSANSGSYILSSELYLRVLVSMVIVGVMTALKRTILTLYFNRRKFETYKPRLEEILNDIISIADVAELSTDADTIADTLGIRKEDSVEDFKKASAGVAVDLRKKKRPTHVRWSSVKFSSKDTKDTPTSGGSVAGSENFDDASVDTGDASGSDTPNFPTSSFSSFTSSHMAIKDLLIKWEEPVNSRDKSYNATVNDILKFRKALTYMDLEQPFSESFGPASTRDEMIDSAELVYERLMRLSPGTVNLSFSVLQLLCIQDDGVQDKAKLQTLKTLFRPNSKGELTLVTFVQACDSVYRRLRYLRASVGNSSVIDQVLESILDSIFSFILGLIVLSFLKLNPWSLLVSLSTLLVTASFAVGPTAAKAIEGIVLIVGRRPFDIGDRIIITDQPGGAMPGMGMSWFVEDISLFSTTLRSALTNEVSTVSNGSIANARITNCARSKNAIVHFDVKFHIKCHRGNVIEKFKKGIEYYIDENPQIWDSIILFRCSEINTDQEMVTYALVVRSRYTWQVAARVLQKQGDLHRHCVDLSYKLNIQYDSPNARNILYYGGSLIDGGKKDFKANVLSNQNIRSDGSVAGGSASELPQYMQIMNSLRSNSSVPWTSSERTETQTDSAKLPSDDNKKASGAVAADNATPSEPLPPSLGGQYDDDAAGRQFLTMLQESHQ